MKNELMTLFSIFAAVAVVAVLLCPLQAEAVPSYDVQHIGTGTVAAINNQGDIAANEWVSIEGQILKRGWVSKNGGAPVYLPLPDGMNQSSVADLNGNGLAVGWVTDADYVQYAVAWYPDGAGVYEIIDVSSILGPESTYSQLVAVNNIDVMVGITIEPVIGLLQSARSFAYSDAGGLVRISDFPGYPTDINDANQIVADNLRLDLDTNVVEELGLPDYPNITGSHFIEVDLAAVNNNGSAIGRGGLATGLNNNAAIAKHTNANGWEVLTIGNVGPGAFDINNLEDVTYGAAYTCMSSVVRFAGEGTYCVSSLLVDQGWIVTNGMTKINDKRQLATGASNRALGIGGVVRLVPAGDLSLPSTDKIPRYRLYNPNNSHHHYTTDANEYSVLETLGWIQEGTSYYLFNGMVKIDSVDAVPYLRLYNPDSSEHHWTTDANEYNVLGTIGWFQEGVDGYVFNSQVSGSEPLYRLYNPNSGLHHWTMDAHERNVLIGYGWVDEGIACYVFP